MALGLGEAARQVMKIETSTGKFLVLGMDGREELGRLPEYHVRLAGNNMNLLGMPEDVANTADDGDTLVLRNLPVVRESVL